MSNEYDISRAFKRIENDLMDSMMRNLKRHQAEETELGINWEQWQALQLKEMERYRKENATKFTDDFTDINNRIEDLFNQTYADAQAQEEAKILDDIRKGKYRAQKKDTSFFNVNDGKLNILLERTKADFARAEYAVLRGATDKYRSIIFDAQVYANITNDYKKAVDMATHDYIKNGLRTIEYKGGSKHNISDYAEMAIRTGNKRAYLMGEGNAHDEFGIHTVRVNKRTQACPKCVGFLGKVLVDDVYAGGTPKEAMQKGVPLLSQAIAQGFLHPNCKDIYTMYIEGVSRPSEPWTQDEIDAIVGDYNAEQELKHAQDMQESYARMAKYSLDPSNQEKYRARADGWAQRVADIGAIMPTTPIAPLIAQVADNNRSEDFYKVFADDGVSYLGNSNMAQEVESTLVQMQERYPMQQAVSREYKANVDKIIVTDYKDAYLHLPNGMDDRRLDDWAIAQVFQNDVNGKNNAVIAFNKGLMSNETIGEVIAKRSKAIDLGEAIWDLSGGNATAIATHEWGHIFAEHMTSAMFYDDADAIAYWNWYQSLSKDEIKNGISVYATESRGEFEAECFLEMLMPNPRPLAVKWWSYMEKVIAKGY